MPLIDELRKRYPQFADATDRDLVGQVSNLLGEDPHSVARELGVPISAPGVVTDLKRGVGQLVGSWGSAAQDVPGLRSVGQAVNNWGDDLAFRNPSEINSFSDVLSKPLTTLREGAVEMLPQLGTAMAAGYAGARGGALAGAGVGSFFGPGGTVVGTAAGATIGGLVSAAASMFAQEYGSIRQDQRQKGYDAPEDMLRAAGAGAAAASLEFLGPEALVVRNIARRIAGAGAGFTMRQAEEIAKQGALKYFGKSAAKQGLIEGPLTEFPQSLIEEWGAYGDPFSDGSIDKGLVGAAKGFAGGALPGGAMQSVERLGLKRNLSDINTFLDDPAAPTPDRLRAAGLRREFMVNEDGRAAADQWHRGTVQGINDNEWLRGERAYNRALVQSGEAFDLMREETGKAWDQGNADTVAEAALAGQVRRAIQAKNGEAWDRDVARTLQQTARPVHDQGAFNPYGAGGQLAQLQAGGETGVDTPQLGLFGGGGEVGMTPGPVPQGVPPVGTQGELFRSTPMQTAPTTKATPSAPPSAPVSPYYQAALDAGGSRSSKVVRELAGVADDTAAMEKVRAGIVNPHSSAATVKALEAVHKKFWGRTYAKELAATEAAERAAQQGAINGQGASGQDVPAGNGAQARTQPVQSAEAPAGVGAQGQGGQGQALQVTGRTNKDNRAAIVAQAEQQAAQAQVPASNAGTAETMAFLTHNVTERERKVFDHVRGALAQGATMNAAVATLVESDPNLPARSTLIRDVERVQAKIAANAKRLGIRVDTAFELLGVPQQEAPVVGAQTITAAEAADAGLTTRAGLTGGGHVAEQSVEKPATAAPSSRPTAAIEDTEDDAGQAGTVADTPDLADQVDDAARQALARLEVPAQHLWEQGYREGDLAWEELSAKQRATWKEGLGYWDILEAGSRKAADFLVALREHIRAIPEQHERLTDTSGTGRAGIPVESRRGAQPEARLSDNAPGTGAREADPAAGHAEAAGEQAGREKPAPRVVVKKRRVAEVGGGLASESDTAGPEVLPRVLSRKQIKSPGIQQALRELRDAGVGHLFNLFTRGVQVIATKMNAGVDRTGALDKQGSWRLLLSERLLGMDDAGLVASVIRHEVSHVEDTDLGGYSQTEAFTKLMPQLQAAHGASGAWSEYLGYPFGAKWSGMSDVVRRAEAYAQMRAVWYGKEYGGVSGRAWIMRDFPQLAAYFREVDADVKNQLQQGAQGAGIVPATGIEPGMAASRMEALRSQANEQLYHEALGDENAETGVGATPARAVYSETPEGRPELAGHGVALAEPAFWREMDGHKIYQHKLLADGRHVGYVTLGWKDGEVAALHDIRVAKEERRKGYGEAAVRSVLEHNNGSPLHVRNILSDAREWWQNRGTQIFETEVGEDGDLTEADYLSALGNQRDSRNEREGTDRQGADAGVEGRTGEAGSRTESPGRERSKEDLTVRELAARSAPKPTTGTQNPDIGRMTALDPATVPDNGRDAAALLQKSSNAFVRYVAGRIAPLLKNVEVRVVDIGDKVPARVAALMDTALGLAHLDPATGKVTLYFPKYKANALTEENLLHELLHAATINALQVKGNAAQLENLARQIRYALQTWNGRYPINGKRQQDVTEFFKHAIADADELVSYAFSSPTFRDVMQLMAADGRWFGEYRTPEQLAAVNKNAGVQKQRNIPVPSYSMWDRLVDAIASVLGFPKARRAALEAALARNQAIDENNKRADTVEFATLAERMDALFDELLANAAALDVSAQQGNQVQGRDDHQGGLIKPNAALVAHDPRDAKYWASRTAAAVPDFLSRVTPDWMTIGQLADKFHGVMPSLRQHVRTMGLMEEAQQRKDLEARGVVKKWNALPDAVSAKLESLMHDSTMAEIHPDVAIGHDLNKHVAASDRAKHADLARRWDELTPGAKNVYREVRDALADNWKERGRVFRDITMAGFAEPIAKARATGDTTTVGKLEAERDALIEKNQKMLRSMKGPYFPLMRSGDYIVVAEAPAMRELEEQLDKLEGDAKKAAQEKLNAMRGGDGYIVRTFTSRFDAERYAKAQEAAGMAVRVRLAEEHTRAMQSAELFNVDKVVNGLMTRMNMGQAEEAKIRGALTDLYLSSLPVHSAIKRELKRKGVAGADTDMRRVVAHALQQDAYHLARLRYSTQIADNMAAMQMESKRSVDAGEAYNSVKRRLSLDYSYKETPVIDRIANASSLWHLGVSPAYLITNMTQPWLVAAPVLAAKYGVTTTGSTLAKATADAVRILRASKGGRLMNMADIEINEKSVPDAAERAMLLHIRDLGQLDITQNSELATTARGTNKAWAKTSEYLNWATHHIEAVNRMSTALAAYRLEKAKNPSATAEALNDVAYKAVVDTQFDYSNVNAAYWMKRGSLGGAERFIFQFRKYQQAMLYMLLSNSVKAFKGDKQAQLTLAYLLGSGFAMAGAVGFPAFTMVLGILSSVVGDADDEDGDWETRLRNWMAETFGPQMARLIWKGLPAALGVDLSKRVGMGDIANPFAYMRTREKDTAQDTAGKAMFTLSGAPVAMLASIAEGVSQLRGEPMKGAEKIAPKWLANPVKAARFHDEGLTNTSGNTILGKDEFGAGSLVMQALGFQPTKLSEYYDAASAKEKTAQAIEARRNKLLAGYAKYKLQGNDEDVAAMEEAIQNWNAKHPEKGLRIDRSSMIRAVKSRRDAARDASDTGVRFTRQQKGLRGIDAFAAGA